ncbi:Alpha/Beta hydrolase protein [Chytriomyces cf. hyalinus JEL632]|nr:Alpha/Beta hydrolase protein [Chytriomyces cf. hyalinus JEL632]
MLQLLQLLLACCLAIASPLPRDTASLAALWGTRGSKYPTVFLHGILGWGEEKPLLGHLNYFGGLSQNILANLRNEGHSVVAPSMGPLSSNWERACEAFAQIVGAKTDYGLARSARFKHDRFGLNHSGKAMVPGFSSNFAGSATGADSTNKINLVGHSLGGSTARFLTHLLSFGSQEEMDACAAASVECSPLFWTNRTQSYVNGLFALSGVHQGSVVDDFLHANGGLMTFIKGFANTVVGINNFNNKDLIWDLQLGHYGLRQDTDEAFSAYLHRVCESGWFLSDSTAVHDLTVAAHETPLLSFVRNSASTTYFSVAGVTTNHLLGVSVAKLSTNAFLAPFADIIGTYTNASLPVLSTFSKREWRQNDGMVMLASSRGPRAGFSSFEMDIGASYDTKLVQSAPGRAPEKGVYNYVGALDGFDHFDLIALVDIIPGQVDGLYSNILRVLNALAP